MNTKRLAQIIKDPGVATDKEVQKINALSEEYSYSPFLKVLQARLDNLHESKDKAKSLTKAAIYIADRSILKDFISNDKLSTAPSKEMPSKSKDKEDKELHKAAGLIVEEKHHKKYEKAAVKHEEFEATEEAREEIEEKKVKEIVEEEAIEELAEASSKEITKQEELSEVQGITAENPDERLSEKYEEKPEEKQEIEQEISKEESEHTETVDAVDEKASGEDTTEEQTEIEEAGEATSDTTEIFEQGPETIKIDKHQEVEAEEKEQYTEADFKKEKQEIDSGKSELTKTEASEPQESDDDKIEPSSLSKEIMKNISELKKHKASLLNLLNFETSSTDKPPKKGKSQKKDGHKDKKKDSGSEEIKSEKSDLKASPSTDDHENKNYPDYEEEDPVVIKDFLTKLEETNPPPKKKLKKEEQEKLIEKFIKSDPQMQNVLSSKELSEKKDLSAPSVKFRDDIISENLANIMIKQGKHEKAIDIYKKLIWKFPQKKAYFATQIEELKKKLKK